MKKVGFLVLFILAIFFNFNHNSSSTNENAALGLNILTSLASANAEGVVIQCPPYGENYRQCHDLGSDGFGYCFCYYTGITLDNCEIIDTLSC